MKISVRLGPLGARAFGGFWDFWEFWVFLKAFGASGGVRTLLGGFGGFWEPLWEFLGVFEGFRKFLRVSGGLWSLWRLLEASGRWFDLNVNA